MKRTLRFALTMLALVALLAALTGCETLGIGNSGNGIPQVGQAKVKAPVISQDGILRVGVDAANAPFSTLVDGKMVGIDADIAAALADELGLKVNVVDVGAAPEDALKSGTVDIVLGMDASDTSATCWLSDPYLATAVAIFAASSGDILPSEADKPVIAAQESSMSAWEITNQFGDEALHAVPDLKTVFEGLESGNPDSPRYGAADAIIGSYVSHTMGGKAMIVGLMQKPSGYCAGVAADNVDLQLAINDAVKAIADKGMVKIVEEKWIGTTLNLDSIALTEAASKGEAKDKDKDKDKESKKTELGDVGTNAVDLQDDGSTQNNNAAADTYWGWNYDYNQQYQQQTTPAEQQQAPNPADGGTVEDEPANQEEIVVEADPSVVEGDEAGTGGTEAVDVTATADGDIVANEAA